MDYTKLIDIAAYTIPSLVTGGVAYYFFDGFVKNEKSRRRFLLHKDAQKNVLPIRLQAYERMTLFLERISPAKLVIRIAPGASNDKNEYENLLIHHIDQEFEHNLTQQVYLSDEAWSVILTAKNTIIQMIRKAAMKAETADQLRETLLSELLERESPSVLALTYIKNEVSELFR